MVVHFGHPCRNGPVLKIAKKYNLKIIEDCAEADEYKNKKVGSIGDVAAFFFFQINNTRGEGGMVTTNSDEIAESKKFKNLAYGKYKVYTR